MPAFEVGGALQALAATSAGGAVGSAPAPPLASSMPARPTKMDDSAAPFRPGGRGGQSLDRYGLPKLVVGEYMLRGVTGTYRWQDECLALPGVLEPAKGSTKCKNLVYCAPTSGGKTLVAEIIMLRRILDRKITLPDGKDRRPRAIFAVPYKSLVQEKAGQLRRLLNPGGTRKRGDKYVVAAMHGTSDPLLKDACIAVCTFERASGLLSQIWREYEDKRSINRQHEAVHPCEIRCVVVDEVHMLAEDGRGPLVECLLAKVKALSDPHGPAPDLQLVCMSATMPNVGDLAAFLDATLYETSFRPVQLTEFVLVGPHVFTLRHSEANDGSKAANSAGAGAGSSDGGAAKSSGPATPAAGQGMVTYVRTLGRGGPPEMPLHGPGPRLLGTGHGRSVPGQGGASSAVPASSGGSSVPGLYTTHGRPGPAGMTSVPPAGPGTYNRPGAAAATASTGYTAMGAGSVPPSSSMAPPPLPTRRLSPGDIIPASSLVDIALCPMKVADEMEAFLSAETVVEGGQVLVFKATKASVESTAVKICARVFQDQDVLTSALAAHAASLSASAAASGGDHASTGMMDGRLRFDIPARRQARVNAIRDIQKPPVKGVEPSKFGSVLCRLIEQGVAFHHAGLTDHERHTVESLYSDGALAVLVSTSTLAAGINLPARRVLIEPLIAWDILDAVRYKQMAGRAGRAGLDGALARGESIVLLHAISNNKIANSAAATRRFVSDVAAVLQSGLQPAQPRLIEGALDAAVAAAKVGGAIGAGTDAAGAGAAAGRSTAAPTVRGPQAKPPSSVAQPTASTLTRVLSAIDGQAVDMQWSAGRCSDLAHLILDMVVCHSSCVSNTDPGADGTAAGAGAGASSSGPGPGTGAASSSGVVSTGIPVGALAALLLEHTFAGWHAKALKPQYLQFSRSTVAADTSFLHQVLYSCLRYLQAQGLVTVRLPPQAKAAPLSTERLAETVTWSAAWRVVAAEPGKAATDAALKPHEAVMKSDQLEEARRRFLLEDSVHCLYLCAEVHVPLKLSAKGVAYWPALLHAARVAAESEGDTPFGRLLKLAGVDLAVVQYICDRAKALHRGDDGPAGAGAGGRDGPVVTPLAELPFPYRCNIVRARGDGDGSEATSSRDASASAASATGRDAAVGAGAGTGAGSGSVSGAAAGAGAGATREPYFLQAMDYCRWQQVATAIVLKPLLDGKTASAAVEELGSMGVILDKDGLVEVRERAVGTARSMVVFCNSMGWDLLMRVIGSARDRLASRHKKEISALMELPGMEQPWRAYALVEAGLTGFVHIAGTPVEQIKAILLSKRPYQAVGGQSAAKVHAEAVEAETRHAQLIHAAAQERQRVPAGRAGAQGKGPVAAGTSTAAGAGSTSRAVPSGPVFDTRAALSAVAGGNSSSAAAGAVPSEAASGAGPTAPQQPGARAGGRRPRHGIDDDDMDIPRLGGDEVLRASGLGLTGLVLGTHQELGAAMPKARPAAKHTAAVENTVMPPGMEVAVSDPASAGPAVGVGAGAVATAGATSSAHVALMQQVTVRLGHAGPSAGASAAGGMSSAAGAGSTSSSDLIATDEQARRNFVYGDYSSDEDEEEDDDDGDDYGDEEDGGSEGSDHTDPDHEQPLAEDMDMDIGVGVGVDGADPGLGAGLANTTASLADMSRVTGGALGDSTLDRSPLPTMYQTAVALLLKNVQQEKQARFEGGEPQGQQQPHSDGQAGPNGGLPLAAVDTGADTAGAAAASSGIAADVSNIEETTPGGGRGRGDGGAAPQAAHAPTAPTSASEVAAADTSVTRAKAKAAKATKGRMLLMTTARPAKLDDASATPSSRSLHASRPLGPHSIVGAAAARLDLTEDHILQAMERAMDDMDNGVVVTADDAQAGGTGGAAGAGQSAASYPGALLDGVTDDGEGDGQDEDSEDGAGAVDEGSGDTAKPARPWRPQPIQFNAHALVRATSLFVHDLRLTINRPGPSAGDEAGAGAGDTSGTAAAPAIELDGAAAPVRPRPTDTSHQSDDVERGVINTSGQAGAAAERSGVDRTPLELKGLYVHSGTGVGRNRVGVWLLARPGPLLHQAPGHAAGAGSGGQEHDHGADANFDEASRVGDAHTASDGSALDLPLYGSSHVSDEQYDLVTRDDVRQALALNRSLALGTSHMGRQSHAAAGVGTSASGPMHVDAAGLAGGLAAGQAGGAGYGHAPDVPDAPASSRRRKSGTFGALQASGRPSAVDTNTSAVGAVNDADTRMSDVKRQLPLGRPSVAEGRPSVSFKLGHAVNEADTERPSSAMGPPPLPARLSDVHGRPSGSNAHGPLPSRIESRHSGAFGGPVPQAGLKRRSDVLDRSADRSFDALQVQTPSQGPRPSWPGQGAAANTSGLNTSAASGTAAASSIATFDLTDTPFRKFIELLSSQPAFALHLSWRRRPDFEHHHPVFGRQDLSSVYTPLGRAVFEGGPAQRLEDPHGLWVALMPGPHTPAAGGNAAAGLGSMGMGMVAASNPRAPCLGGVAFAWGAGKSSRYYIPLAPPLPCHMRLEPTVKRLLQSDKMVDNERRLLMQAYRARCGLNTSGVAVPGDANQTGSSTPVVSSASTATDTGGACTVASRLSAGGTGADSAKQPRRAQATGFADLPLRPLALIAHFLGFGYADVAMSNERSQWSTTLGYPHTSWASGATGPADVSTRVAMGLVCRTWAVAYRLSYTAVVMGRWRAIAALLGKPSGGYFNNSGTAPISFSPEPVLQLPGATQGQTGSGGRQSTGPGPGSASGSHAASSKPAAPASASGGRPSIGAHVPALDGHGPSAALDATFLSSASNPTSHHAAPRHVPLVILHNAKTVVRALHDHGVRLDGVEIADPVIAHWLFDPDKAPTIAETSNKRAVRDRDDSALSSTSSDEITLRALAGCYLSEREVMAARAQATRVAKSLQTPGLALAAASAVGSNKLHAVSPGTSPWLANSGAAGGRGPGLGEAGVAGRPAKALRLSGGSGKEPAVQPGPTDTSIDTTTAAVPPPVGYLCLDPASTWTWSRRGLALPLARGRLVLLDLHRATATTGPRTWTRVC